MDVRSFNTSDIDAFKNQLQTEFDKGFKPTLALCFSDASFDFRALSSYLHEMDIDTMGTTTCGEICNESCNEGTCTVLLMEANRDAYHIELVKFQEGEDVASKQIAEVAQGKFSNQALITYASKVGANGDKLVRGYKEILGPQAPIFGGLAGDNFKNEEFTVFNNDSFETEGLVALILDTEKIRVEGKAYSGWEELGKTHVVTKVEGNVLYEIDHGPALDLFIEYFGIEKSDTSDGEAMITIPGIYPLKVLDKDNVDYLRSPLFYDRTNNSLILAGEVQHGDRVKFCPMPDIDTVTKTVDFFQEYAKSNADVDTVIITSCAGRKFAFGPLMNKEIKEIYNIWEVPTAGLMALGEIGVHFKENVCNFHNVTCSLVSLTEIQ